LTISLELYGRISNVYKILSLPGGGARGIYQAAYLQAIAPSFPGKLGRQFDLISGTSTGSIVAAAVAFDVDLDKVVGLFKEKAPAIFARRWLSSIRKGPRYSAAVLRDELDKLFGNSTLKDASRRLLIPATVLNPRYAARQFSTFCEPGVQYVDPQLKVVDVVMASCAAPSYFAPVEPAYINSQGKTVSEGRAYSDGGMWANSPSLDAVISANCYEKCPFDQIKLLSLGNGETVQRADPKRFARLRPISVDMITSIFEMMFAAQSKSADQLAEMLLGPERVLSLNSTLQEPIPLDDAARAIELLPPLAVQDAANDLARVTKFLQ
jgi:patatin-like phospholipase/acyl hydrolase